MTREEYGNAYRQGFTRTIRFLLSRGARADRASDVAQGAWMKGWQRLGQLRNEERIFTWVNTIALNLYRSALRSEPGYEALSEFSNHAEPNYAAIDLSRILTMCRPYERSLLEAQLLGVTAQEIARRHGITETAVRIRLLRARRAARAHVEDFAIKSQERYGLTQRGVTCAV